TRTPSRSCGPRAPTRSWKPSPPTVNELTTRDTSVRPASRPRRLPRPPSRCWLHFVSTGTHSATKYVGNLPVMRTAQLRHARKFHLAEISPVDTGEPSRGKRRGHSR